MLTPNENPYVAVAQWPPPLSEAAKLTIEKLANAYANDSTLWINNGRNFQGRDGSPIPLAIGSAFERAHAMPGDVHFCIEGGLGMYAPSRDVFAEVIIYLHHDVLGVPAWQWNDAQTSIEPVIQMLRSATR